LVAKYTGELVFKIWEEIKTAGGNNSFLLFQSKAPF